MKDPVTGQEFHTFENAMPEKEVDESLNPSFDSMERLTEVSAHTITQSLPQIPNAESMLFFVINQFLTIMTSSQR